MSIASEIERIRNAKNALKSVINARGGSLAGETIEYYADAVSALPSGDGSVDLSFVTAQAGDIRSGKVGASSTGTPVIGTLDPSSGSSGMDFYKCSSVDTSAKTWNGFKAVLTDGIYTFEESITAGLSYTAVTPVIDKIYTADALCEIKTLYNGSSIPTEGQVFYASFCENKATAETGQTFNVSGNPVYGEIDGIPCVTFDGQSTVTFSDAGFPTGTAARTMSCWVKVNSFVNGYHAVVWGYGEGSMSKYMCLEMRTTRSINCGGYEADLETDSGLWELGKWYHVAMTKDGNTETIYLDGNVVKTGTTSKNTLLGTGLISGIPWAGGVHLFNGSLASCRIYDRVLTDDEIMKLAKEFDV
ncbi:MAG: LamG domain-containing protein [Lentisphaeria bacterium]|nr:LamG domain-containing protein [Lentisphaeria bacterium]